MRWTIGRRIFVALTVASLVIVGLNAAATRWSFQQGFAGYLSQQETERLSGAVDELAGLYRREDSWQLLRTDRRAWDELFRDRYAPRPMDGDARRPKPRGMPPPDPLGLRERVSLVDADGVTVRGRESRDKKARSIDVTLDGAVIGRLFIEPQPGLTETIDLNFARQQSESIAYIAVAVLLLAAAIAALIAKQLVRPIAALTAGTRSLGAGEFEKRITVTRDDELGDLARDFNKLAETLQKNQRSRRQWVSDISHELRTPLAILSGELQAIEDGVRRFDEGTRRSLQAEVDRLQKLVGDLHELTMSDEGGLRYRLETIDIVSILQDVLGSNRSRLGDAGLYMSFEVTEQNLLIAGDSSRLDQLFSNLIENSIRYTDEPGTIEIGVTATEQQVIIVFADSAPGVHADQYPRLFDRLYRVDESRNRATGGSGLGLSICESIVTAHSGEIVAEASHLGGLSVRITLPRLGSQEVSV